MSTDAGLERIGVTGHIHLTHDTEVLVAAALRAELHRIGDQPVRGVTCLAGGTDQIFARTVLDLGGTYEVILPARDYREAVIAPGQRASFDELLDRAVAVVHTGHDRSGTAAFVAANRELVRRVQRLVAVWDGGAGLPRGVDGPDHRPGPASGHPDLGPLARRCPSDAPRGVLNRGSTTCPLGRPTLPGRTSKRFEFRRVPAAAVASIGAVALVVAPTTPASASTIRDGWVQLCPWARSSTRVPTAGGGRCRPAARPP